MSMRTKSSLYSTEIGPLVFEAPLFRNVVAMPDTGDVFAGDLDGLDLFPFDGAGNVVLRFWANEDAFGKDVDIWIYEAGRRVPNPAYGTTPTTLEYLYAAPELIAKLNLVFSGEVVLDGNPVTRAADEQNYVSAHSILEISAGAYLKSANLVQLMQGIADGGTIGAPDYDGASAVIQIGRLMGSGIIVYVKEASLPSGLTAMLVECVPVS